MPTLIPAPALPTTTIVVEQPTSPTPVPTATQPIQSPSPAARAATPFPTSTPAPVLAPTPTSATVSTATQVPPRERPGANPITPVETPPPPTSTPTTTPTVPPPTEAPPETPAQPQGLTVRIGPGSIARFLVREQFVRLAFPNDAIGETSEVNGSIAFDADGVVQQDGSTITVNLKSLRSDEEDRDDFLQTNSLESIKFPMAVFVVEDTPGMPWPLPQETEMEFQLQGTMTMHGVTRPLTWDATARLTPDGLTGRARTSFKFEKFDMEKPSRYFLLTVEDNIRLELDFVGAIISGPTG